MFKNLLKLQAKKQWKVLIEKCIFPSKLHGEMERKFSHVNDLITDIVLNIF